MQFLPPFLVVITNYDTTHFQIPVHCHSSRYVTHLPYRPTTNERTTTALNVNVDSCHHHLTVTTTLGVQHDR